MTTEKHLKGQSYQGKYVEKTQWKKQRFITPRSKYSVILLSCDHTIFLSFQLKEKQMHYNSQLYYNTMNRFLQETNFSETH